MIVAPWVLIFINLSGLAWAPSVNMTPIYFETKAACDAVALEFNNGGPEPSKDSPTKRSSGAICRATGATS